MKFPMEMVMSRRRSALFIWLGLAGLALMMSFPAHAAGNAKRGGQIAERWCAACHIVAPGAVRLSEDPPASFQEIADTPGMGEMALRVFFQTPHRQMPNFSITDDVRDDLIAYITGLKRK
jgi:mono/diheme cytochrome c family protein